MKRQKKNRVQKRPVLEATVLKTFKSDNETLIVIVNQETDSIIEITPNSSKDDIRRYLGEKFVV